MEPEKSRKSLTAKSSKSITGYRMESLQVVPPGLRPHEKDYHQLFISKKIVTEDYELNGGILVDDKGTIIKLVKKAEAMELKQRLEKFIEIIDAEDLVIMPGVVDSHVHVNEPGRTEWEGYKTATEAAAAGGITTIIDMPLNAIPPTTTYENLRTKIAAATGNVFVDVGFWGGVIPGNQDSLKELVKAGVVGFKCFLCPSGVDEFPHVGPEDLKKAFAALEGTGSLLAFHAELEEDTKRKFVDCHRSEDKVHFQEQEKGDEPDPRRNPILYETFLNTRPSIMEVRAIRLVTDIVHETDVRVHIVHVSAADVVPMLEEAREKRRQKGHTAWRGGITAETCHHYLTLSAENIPDGQSEFKCCPPIRDNANREKLWQYLMESKLDMVVSDHSPCTPMLKTPNNLEAWGGISSLQFGLSLLWTEAKKRGLKLNFVVDKLCTSTAKLCGLGNKKGSLKPGADADIIFLDPDAEFEVNTDMIRHKYKLTPYVEMNLKGVVKKTFLRGQLIYDGTDLVGEPQGQLLLNKYRREYPDYMYEN